MTRHVKIIQGARKGAEGVLVCEESNVHTVVTRLAGDTEDTNWSPDWVEVGPPEKDMRFESFWGIVEEYGHAAYDDMDEPGVAARAKETIRLIFERLSRERLPTHDEAYRRASDFVVNTLPLVIPAGEIGLDRGMKLIEMFTELFEGGPFITPKPGESVEAVRKQLGEVRIEELMSPDSETGRLYMLVSYGKNARAEDTLPQEVVDRLNRFSLGKPGRPPLTHVAVRDTDGMIWSLPRPNRHHHVLKVMYDHGVRQMEGGNHDNQGFLDQNGKYLNRKQAMVNAELNGQITKNGGNIIGGVLTSEDLWES